MSASDGINRWNRAGKTAGAQVAARVISGVCLLVQTPLLLRHFGTESFGWIMAVTSVAGLSQFLDLGSAIAFQQRLSVVWSSGAGSDLAVAFSSGKRLLSLIAACCALPTLALLMFLGPRYMPAPLGGDQAACWAAIALSIPLGLRYSAGPRIAAAVQEGWISAGWTTAANVASLAAVAAAVRMDAGPLGFVLILILAQIAPGIAAEVHMTRRLGISRLPADPSVAREIWNEGVHYALPNIAGAVLQVATPFLFSKLGGYAANAAFSILQRLFGPVVQGHALVLAPLWPAYTEAHVAGHRGWVRRTFKISVALTTACVCVLAGIVAGLPWICSLWLGRAAPSIPAGFACLLALWSAVVLMNQAISYLLLGLGKLTGIAAGVGFAHLGTLLAMTLGGLVWGSMGVAGGLALGALFLATPQYLRSMWREVKAL